VRIVELDVRNPAHAKAAADQARDVTLLTNNAGTLSVGGPADVSLSAVRDDMETHLFGTLPSSTPSYRCSSSTTARLSTC
jgi:NAD(P)-dependent dehydrogenase (short-subunit alcohol dehydrogenase family)